LKTIVCIGTGPSLTIGQVNTARDKGFELYVCNNAFNRAIDATLLYGCNYEWWKYYYSEVEKLPCQKWTTNRQAADEFGINWIAEKNAKGLSNDPNVIHHGHGSGYSLVSMAHRNGADRIVLLGYDLKYAPDYDGRARRIGSKPRHFFNEYPTVMQHWPSERVINGIHVELVDLYESIKEQGLVELINCTPGSALIECLGYVDIGDL